MFLSYNNNHSFFKKNINNPSDQTTLPDQKKEPTIKDEQEHKDEPEH